MSVQTAYTIAQPIAYAGLIYALHPSDIDSRDVETTAGIEFGVAVGRGSDADRQVDLGGAPADFLGITVRDLSQEAAANTGAILYEENSTASILRRGYIWAVCPAGCAPGEAVFYVNATGVLDQGTASTGETQLDRATWETTAAAGELAVIRLETTATTAGS